jgi:hypothetical protein
MCGASFEVDELDKNRRRRKYCGEECAVQAAYQRKRDYAQNGKKMFNVECETCGKIFITCYSQKVTCSMECSHERAKKMARGWNRARREAILNGTRPAPDRKKPKQKKVATVEEIQKKAREAGMSYGQYMAQLYMQEGRTGNGGA